MKLRSVLFFAGALGFAGILYHQSNKPIPVTNTGEMFVFYPSKCEKPRDSSHCSKLPATFYTTDGKNPTFKSMDSCMSFGSEFFKQFPPDPTVMISCEKMRGA
jgi:hypothetical protein